VFVLYKHPVYDLKTETCCSLSRLYAKMCIAVFYRLLTLPIKLLIIA